MPVRQEFLVLVIQVIYDFGLYYGDLEFLRLFGDVPLDSDVEGQDHSTLRMSSLALERYLLHALLRDRADLDHAYINWRAALLSVL